MAAATGTARAVGRHLAPSQQKPGTRFETRRSDDLVAGNHQHVGNHAKPDSAHLGAHGKLGHGDCSRILGRSSHKPSPTLDDLACQQPIVFCQQALFNPIHATLARGGACGSHTVGCVLDAVGSLLVAVRPVCTMPSLRRR